MQPTPTLLRRCAHSYEHNPRQSTRLRGERAIQGPTLPASTLVPTSATLMRQSVSQFQFTLRQNKPYFILFNHLSPIKCSADAAGRLRRRSSNAPPTPPLIIAIITSVAVLALAQAGGAVAGLRGCRHWDGHGQRQHWWVSSVRHGYKCEQRQPWSIGASRNRDTRRWYRCKPEPHQSNQQPGRSTHHVEVAGGGAGQENCLRWPRSKWSADRSFWHWHEQRGADDRWTVT